MCIQSHVDQESVLWLPNDSCFSFTFPSFSFRFSWFEPDSSSSGYLLLADTLANTYHSQDSRDRLCSSFQTCHKNVLVIYFFSLHLIKECMTTKPGPNTPRSWCPWILNSCWSPRESGRNLSTVKISTFTFLSRPYDTFKKLIISYTHISLAEVVSNHDLREKCIPTPFSFMHITHVFFKGILVFHSTFFVCINEKYFNKLQSSDSQQ